MCGQMGHREIIVLQPVSLALWRGIQGYLPHQGDVKLRACLGSGLQIRKKPSFLVVVGLS